MRSDFELPLHVEPGEDDMSHHVLREIVRRITEIDLIVSGIAAARLASPCAT